jgi:hypothetical protein
LGRAAGAKASFYQTTSPNLYTKLGRFKDRALRTQG